MKTRSAESVSVSKDVPLNPAVELLARLPSKDRHDIRSAILSLRISSELLMDGHDLTDDQRSALLSEMRDSALLLETAFVRSSLKQDY